MAEQGGAKFALMRSAFVAIALLTMYWQLLPLDTVPSTFAGPDLLLVLCAAWVIRRPEYAPIYLIAAVMLLADFLFLRPPGLFAAITVFACENLRRRSLTNPDMHFSVEWLTAAGAMTAIVLANRVFSAMFVIDQTSLGLTLIQLIMSIVAYPIVVGFCALFLGLRKVAPHQRDGQMGRA